MLEKEYVGSITFPQLSGAFLSLVFPSVEFIA